MSATPSGSTRRRFRKLNRAAFSRWLNRQPALKRFYVNDCYQCPLGQYTNGSVGSDTYSYAFDNYALPEWAKKFVDKVDHHPAVKVTVATARRFLREIPRG